MLIFMSCLFMFYFGVVLFFVSKKHVLLTLLTLEFLSLIILMMLINFFTIYMYDSSVIIYLMIIMVCEAVMGLVLITLLVRTHGSDYSKSSIVLAC